LFARKLKAYIIPKIKSNEDISNFDDYGEKEHRIEAYDDDGSNWDSEFAS